MDDHLPASVHRLVYKMRRGTAGRDSGTPRSPEDPGAELRQTPVDHIKGSLHQNMKELRVQFKGSPVRILFAFAPDRQAVKLLGGAKTGDERWYRRNLPLADRGFTAHLQEMEQGKRKAKEKKP